MWNCRNTGKIRVKTGDITPEEIQAFIYEHMAVFSKAAYNKPQDALNPAQSQKNQPVPVQDITRVSSSSKLSEQEEDMLCPRYVIKIIGKYSYSSTIKLFYTVDSLMSAMMGSLSHGDLIVQPFIRQKHICKPSLIRYYMKSNSGVHKANSIINRHVLNKRT